VHAERVGERVDVVQANIAFSSLYPSDVIPVYARPIGEALLRQPAFGS
jgi:hypothetical protein